MVWSVLLIVLGIFSILRIERISTDAAEEHRFGYSLWRKQLFYQPAALVTVVVLFGLNRLINVPGYSLDFFGLADARTFSFARIGIADGTSWTEVGLTFSVVAMLLTAVVVYFQLLRRRKIVWSGLPLILLFSVAFSISNALVEELLFRGLIYESFNAHLDQVWVCAISAIVFGIQHYFGNPGRIPGVLMAGVLGWILMVSLYDTNGIAWAWLIHLCVDLPIFMLLQLQEQSTELPR